MLHLELSKKNLLPRSAWQWWRVITYLVLGGLLACIIGSSHFMYTYIYRTLDDAQTIVVLNSNERIGNLNITGFEKAMSLLQEKSTIAAMSKPTRDIFSFVSSTTGTKL